MSQSGHGLVRCKCPLLGAKRTRRFALQMSAYDPKRTLGESHGARRLITTSGFRVLVAAKRAALHQA